MVELTQQRIDEMGADLVDEGSLLFDITAADAVSEVVVNVTPVVGESQGQQLRVSAEESSTDVLGLRNGVVYSVTVTAVGPEGAGPLSDAVEVTPTSGVEGEIGGVLVKRDPATPEASDVPAAEKVTEVALTDEGEAGDGIDKVGLSQAVSVPKAEEIALTISAEPEVEWAEPDLVVLPASVGAVDSSQSSQWNLTGDFGIGQVNDPAAGDGVTVAVIDTGIAAHPDLDSRLVAGYDFVSDPAVLAAVRTPGGEPVPFDGDYVGDFGGLGRDADPRDPGDWRDVAPVRDSSWHGTHTAGVIAQAVPGAKIQPIRALSWRGGLLSDVAASISWASGGNVEGVPTNATPSRIINLSFSVQAACPNTLQTAIDDAVARGSVIVAAAGNNNDDATAYAPGNCANVITVGAIGADGKRANYSNFGAVVDASAPGGAISSDGGVIAASNTGTTTPDAPTTSASQGTSIAAAHTAATLAVLAADNPNATPNEITSLLSGRYLRNFPGDTCDASTDVTCGAGIVQIAADPVAFTCQPKLFQSADGSSGVALFEYNATSNSYTQVGSGTTGSPNAAGYNTGDNFIYGVRDKKLFRIDADGAYVDVSDTLTSDSEAISYSPNSGDFWGPNRLIIGTSGKNSWYSVDVSTPSNPVVSPFPLTNPDGTIYGAADFTVLGSRGYGVSHQQSNTLNIIDLEQQTIVQKSLSGLNASGTGFGAAYADALGNLYFHENGARVWRILAEDINSDPVPISDMGPAPTIDGSSSTLGVPNDGASCPDAASAFSAEITNETASNVSANQAILTADVNPNGASTTALICYGTTSATSGGALQGCTQTAQAANASTASPLTGTSAVTLDAITVTGLTERTTYYWQVVTTSQYATTYGDVQSFTTTGAPIATTQAATSVTTTGATLNGIVNPGNRSTTVSFCYGTASDLTDCTSQSAGESPLSGTSDATVSAVLTGLASGTRYYARVDATNADGSASGSVISFATSALPQASVASASNVTSTDARLNGIVNPEGLATTVTFCFGTNADLSSCTDATASESPLLAVSTDIGVSVDITSLTPSTTYHFKVTASNDNGTTASSTGSFTTSARPLVLTTTTGSLPNGVVDSVYSKTLSADGGVAPYTWAVADGSLPPGLSLNPTTGTIAGTPTFPGTSSFTVEVTDATGQSATRTFSIVTVDDPFAVTTSPTSVATTSATLNGTVNPGYLLTAVEFCVGTTPDLTGCSTVTADQSPVTASTITSAVSASATGLTPGTTYYVRAQATNSNGSSNGEIVSFRTTSAPSATTVSATFRDKAGGAILNASVNPQGLSTTVSFCWGTTPTLTSCTSVAADQSPLAAGTDAVRASVDVSGLNQGEVYYFNVTATNSVGTNVGSTVEFTMPTIDAPTPTITSVTPSSGDATGGTSVTITGTNFSDVGAGPSVAFGDSAATVDSFTSTSITVTTPSGTPGSVDVIVFNLDGQAVRATDAFTYTSAVTYGVTYNANGATSGTAPTDATDYSYNQTATIEGAGTLARTGYEFAGWNTSAVGTGSSYSVGESLTMTSDVTLYAQWTAVASPSLSPSSRSFGSKAIGSSTSITQILSVANAGAANLTIDSGGITVTGSDASDFTVSGGTCSSGGTVTGFSSCTIEVEFEPTEIGSRSASLEVATAEGTVSATLSGTGTSGSSDSGGGSSSGGSSSETGTSAGTPNLPPIEVVLTSGVMLVNGEWVPMTPERGPSGGMWIVSGDDFSREFVPRAAESGLYEGPAETLRAPVGGQVRLTGDGYLGESSVSVHLVPPTALSDPGQASAASVNLGDASVNPQGGFSVILNIPASVAAGDYVLQVNGWSPVVTVRSVNMNVDLYEALAARSITKAAFYEGKSSTFSKNGRRKLREIVSSVPDTAKDIAVGITAVSVSIDDVEKDLRLAAIRGRKLRDYLSARGLEGRYSITIRTEDEIVTRRRDPLRFSSRGKPLTTVEVSFSVPR